MIPSLIRPAIPPSPTSPESPEDIFSSTPGLIFTDDTRNQHGDPGSGVIYKNGVFGDIELQLVDPNKEDERRLFAHYVWNAGILLSELVAGRREWDLEGSGEVGEQDGEGEGAGKEVGRIRQSVEFKVYSWSVKGETVLELGAGSGLVGIISTLSEASTIAITDFPSQDILATIRKNVSRNVPQHLSSRVLVQGHEWGDFSSDFALSHTHAFTRVLAADTLWLDSQHEALLGSMAHFLSEDAGSRIWVVAGFHTGRAKVAGFIDKVSSVGLVVDEIWEVDIDGRTRLWARERDGGKEDISGRKKWCLVAVLENAQELGNENN